jgi:hypothetical protein
MLKACSVSSCGDNVCDSGGILEKENFLLRDVRSA